MKLAWLGRWRDLLSRLSIYLPVVLMGLLVLASYWLLRVTPAPVQPEPEMPVSEDPDFYVRRFVVKAFDENGRIRAELRGSEGRHYPHNATLVIDEANVRSISDKGLVSRASALRITANDEQTEFLLEGDAVVVREEGKDAEGRVIPRAEFHGPQLLVITRPQERVLSDQPVLLIRGKDQITADTLDYTGNDIRVAEFHGRVNALFAPRP
jgi:lipopolysaccharide export system protein LptC